MNIICPSISQNLGKRKDPTQKTKDYSMMKAFLLISYTVSLNI